MSKPESVAKLGEPNENCYSCKGSGWINPIDFLKLVFSRREEPQEGEEKKGTEQVPCNCRGM